MSPTPKPLYDPTQTTPAYRLRYTWFGWLTAGTETRWPDDLLAGLGPAWEADGLRLLDSHRAHDEIRLLFSAKPSVSPILVATRAKGRLSYSLRTSGIAHNFSRKLAVRSIGENTADEVQSYISNQVTAEHFVDPRFAEQLQSCTVEFPEVDLSLPTEVTRGRYWYDLHLVLVTDQRYRIVDISTLIRIRDASIAIAKKKGYQLSRLSAMPDHLHLALRGNPQESPENIVGAFQNNLAYVLGQKRIWRDSFYAGTFGVYNMNAIRRLHSQD